MYPTISQYIETVSDPSGFFRTLTLECERDIYGNPKTAAGGYAAVFKVRIGGKPYALKCYTRDRTSARTIYDELRRHPGPPLYEARYLPREIFISGPHGGAWYGVTLTEWAEGHTLEFEIRKALRGSTAAGRTATSKAVAGGTSTGGGNRTTAANSTTASRATTAGGRAENDIKDAGGNAALAALARSFDLLAEELLNAPWAHGDLKPENIIVSPSGRMRLIDYDAMFVPPLAGHRAEEPGTPLYQHPRRGVYHFDRHIDDYPIALISATLHTLALEEGLHARYGNQDSFLFAPADIADGQSEAYRVALEMAARRGEGLLYGLLRLLASPVPWIDGLREIIAAMNAPSRALGASTPFAREGRWGYLAEDGSVAIPPIFDKALEFRGNTAAVTLGGHDHCISRPGVEQ